MNIIASFRDPSLLADDFAGMLARISPIAAKLATYDASLRAENWRLKGDTLEEAMLYQVYDANGEATPAALAVLREAFRGEHAFTYAALWDGNRDASKGASISCHIADKTIPDRLSITIRGPAWQDYRAVADLVAKIVEVFGPLLVDVSDEKYGLKQVFDDKPGVGWMLYLPHRITTQQVPEARALIPIPSAGRKQTGTIIVSVVDEAFSADNPEHVEIANRIEIRLVDHDLLPTYLSL
ncbi:immunity 52 family protein [Burkholderia gladioli]|uniref:immunity 52 family protein n=1 Tax=Burkholderia gladioli TaxID=28095 RepID=UPI001C21573E|nr:immunity 52 family protein [Burkholderia gladioli]MBU9168234.1 immunity 52 family protein [Burkholderia gladioli]